MFLREIHQNSNRQYKYSKEKPFYFTIHTVSYILSKDIFWIKAIFIPKKMFKKSQNEKKNQKFKDSLHWKNS